MKNASGVWICLPLLGCDAPRAALPTETQDPTATAAPVPSGEVSVAETNQAFSLLRQASPALVAQGAVALGTRCRTLSSPMQAAIRERLLSRAASLGLKLERSPAPQAWHALAHALTLCRSADPQGAEHLLRSWLKVGAEPALAATRALGVIARNQGQLEAETVIALLAQADDSPEAVWFALSGLRYRAASLRTAVLAVARSAQVSSHSAEIYRLLTLARLHPESLPTLVAVALDDARATELRRVAVEALAGAGPSGRRSLRKLKRRAPKGSRLAQLVQAEHERTSARIQDTSSWPKLLRSEQLAQRHAALSLLGRIRDSPKRNAALAAALVHENPGTVAVAARALRSSAERGARFEANHQLQAALRASVEKDWKGDTVATQVALLEAVAALQVLSLRSRVEALCDSRWNAVRSAASGALARLRSPRRCQPISHAVATPLGASPNATLTFKVGARELTLKLVRRSAPRHFDRVVSLAKAGWFDRNPLQHGDSVLQFGDPDGDGMGNGAHDTLPTEVSPHLFRALSVGVAQLDLDSGSTQLFVTLTDRPDLDLRYPYLGSANDQWRKLERNAKIESTRLVILDKKP